MENLTDKIAELLETDEWSPEEKRWVLDYLENSDGETLQQLLLQRYLSEVKAGEHLHPGTSKRMLAEIHARIGVIAPKNNVSNVKIWASAIAAACVLGVIVLF